MTPPRRRDVGAVPLHVFANAVSTDVLFPNGETYQVFWDELGEALTEHGVCIGQICLMTTHYHLLVRAEAEALAEALHQAHSKLAWLRNRDGRRKGRLFARPYTTVPIRDPRHMASVVPYIPRNPVRAGMVTQPGDWRWSTHAALAGVSPSPRWFDTRRALILNGFLDSRSYERFVSAASDRNCPPSSPAELVAHRICTLAAGGLADKVIADVLALPIRRVRATLRESGLTWYRAS